MPLAQGAGGAEFVEDVVGVMGGAYSAKSARGRIAGLAVSPSARSTVSTVGQARSAAAMWVRWRASFTSMSKSTSKKSAWRWRMRMLTMLPPASPMMVQAWPSTPGRVADGGRQARARDRCCVRPRGVHCRSRQSSSLVLVLGQARAVDGVHGQPPPSGWRMPTMRSPGTGLQQSREVQRDAGRQPAAAHVEARAPCRPRSARGRRRRRVLGRLQAGEHRLQHLAGGDPPAADRVVELRPRVAAAKRSSAGRSETSASDLPARSKRLLHRGPAEPRELLLLGRADVAADGRAGAAGDGERAPVGGRRRASAPRITSTTSPFCSAVRSGLSSPLIFTPMAVSPTSVWTA